MSENVTGYDFSKAGLVEGSFNGSTLYINKLIHDEEGVLVMADVVGYDMILQSIVASAALGKNSEAITYIGEDGDHVVVKLGSNDGCGKKGEDKGAIKFEHQIFRMGGGMGSMSRCILISKELSSAITSENEIRFAVIGDNEVDAEALLRAALIEYLPVSLPEDKLTATVDVMRGGADITLLSGVGGCGMRAIISRKRLLNEYLPRILGCEVEVREEQMLDFILRCGEGLADRIRDKMRALYDPAVDKPKAEWVERIRQLKRVPFKAQENCVFPLAAAKEAGLKGAFAVGEMSTGKTTIGTAVTQVVEPNGLHLIMCPPQLTRKWRREIHSIVGKHARVYVLEDWRTVGALFRIAEMLRENKPDTPVYLVLSRTRSRMSEFWKPAVVGRLLPSEEMREAGCRNISHIRYAACPCCGEYVTETVKDEDGSETVVRLTVDMVREKRARLKCSACGAPLWQQIHEHAEHADLAVQRRDMLARWVGDLPGVSKKRALEEIERDGVDVIAREIVHSPERFIRRFCKETHRKRIARIREFLNSIPFTLTPCEVMPYRLIQRLLKGKISVFLADECHELKGEETAQGLAFGALSSAAEFTVPLTGTLIGGYAGDVHPLLQRVAPGHMSAVGYGHNASREYQRDEGVLEETKVVKMERDDLATARGSSTSVRLKRKPGFSAVAIARDLLPHAVFIRLEDLQKEVEELSAKTGGKLRLLPSYREVFIRSPMTPEMKECWQGFSDAFKQYLREMNPSGRSKAAHCMLYAPDLPDQEHVVEWPKSDGDGIQRYAICWPQVCGPDQIQPKERDIINLCLREKRDGRRVMLFAAYTATHDITPRIARLLQDAGLRVVRLRQQVSTSEREEWLNRQVERGVDVVITNPIAVMTGLDLLHFPTLAFMQSGYSTYVLRQASRRGWRIGQTEPCRVYFWAYEDSAQEVALTLMGNKQRVSLIAEGDLSESALDAVVDADDGLAAISRAIAQSKKVSLTSAITCIEEDSFEGEYRANIDHVPTAEEIEAIMNGGHVTRVSEKPEIQDDLNFGLFALVEQESRNKDDADDVSQEVPLFESGSTIKDEGADDDPAEMPVAAVGGGNDVPVAVPVSRPAQGADLLSLFDL